MDFELTPTQTLLAESAASFVRRESPVSRARALRESARGWDPLVWRQLGELGWLGASFPESVGGLGGGMVEAALLLERFGAALVPEPYLSSVLLAGSVVLGGGSAEQHERWLGPMLGGHTSLALAYAEAGGRYGLVPEHTTAERAHSCYRLRGAKQWVLDGHAAQQLVVSARCEGETALFVVEPSMEGVTLRTVRTLDGRRAAFLTLADVTLSEDHRLMQGCAEQHLERALDLAAAGAVAEGLGCALSVLRMTLEHLRTREQFGRPIGTFQALQHAAAQMYIESELLRSSSLQAMVHATADDPRVRRRAVSAGKAQLAESGGYIARQSIQLHGGIGVTDEHDLGLYFKRQLALEALFGDASYHLDRFARASGPRAA